MMCMHAEGKGAKKQNIWKQSEVYISKWLIAITSMNGTCKGAGSHVPAGAADAIEI